MPLEPRTLPRPRQPDRQHDSSLARPPSDSGSRWPGAPRRRRRRRCTSRGHYRRCLIPSRFRSERPAEIRARRTFLTGLRRCYSTRRRTHWRRACRTRSRCPPRSASAATPFSPPPRRTNLTLIPTPTLPRYRRRQRQLRRASRRQQKVGLRFFPGVGRLHRRFLPCYRPRNVRSLRNRPLRLRSLRRCSLRLHLRSRLRTHRLPADLAFKILRLQRLGRVRLGRLLRPLATLFAALEAVTHPFPHIALVAQAPVQRQSRPRSAKDTHDHRVIGSSNDRTI